MAKARAWDTDGWLSASPVRGRPGIAQTSRQKDKGTSLMTTKSKGLLSLLLIGALGSVAGLGVFGAFSSTTSNAGNDFASGTVTIADNDSNAALYNVTNRKPGDSVTSCIKLTCTGSLASDVRLYTTS